MKSIKIEGKQAGEYYSKLEVDILIAGLKTCAEELRLYCDRLEAENKLLNKKGRKNEKDNFSI